MVSIACASGKGGTGKTTIATNLAVVLAKSTPVQLLDCDVEEPNSHLFLYPQDVLEEDVGVLVPTVDESLCSRCGRCADHCRFNAISLLGDYVLVFEELCHSCGVCSYVCGEGAVSEMKRTVGIIRRGWARDVDFVGGRLNVGEAIAVPVISRVKGEVDDDRLVLIDAPPGTTCPTVEAVRGVDLCLLVTEPTPFGLGDLQMAVAMCRKLGVPVAVIVNRHDLGDERTERYCAQECIPVLARLPWDRDLAEAYARGRLVIDEVPRWEKAFFELAGEVMQSVQGGH